MRHEHKTHHAVVCVEALGVAAGAEGDVDAA
jgi:hypothetical protein